MNEKIKDAFETMCKDINLRYDYTLLGDQYKSSKTHQAFCVYASAMSKRKKKIERLRTVADKGREIMISSEAVIDKLEKWIDRLKCCGNCKNFSSSTVTCSDICKVHGRCLPDNICNKWEQKERI
jgi:hypothetical protein